MTIRPDRDEPCWEIVRVDTKRPPREEYGDGWAHYPTEAKARAELDSEREQWDVPLTVQRSFGGPCLALFCDGPRCAGNNEPADLSDEGWTHLDPADPLPFLITDLEWTVEERVGQPDRHYCPNCTPPWCDDCDQQHYGTCDLGDVRPQPVEQIPGQMTLEGCA